MCQIHSMLLRHARVLVWVGLIASAAFGEVWFVRARSARVLAEPRPEAAPREVLTAGTSVERMEGSDGGVWVGVKTASGLGFMHRAALSAQAPALDWTAGPTRVRAMKRTMDGGEPAPGPKAASPGIDDDRALGSAAVVYANEKAYFTALDQLLTTQAIARGVSIERLSAHAADAGLSPVLGAP